MKERYFLISYNCVYLGGSCFGESLFSSKDGTFPSRKEIQKLVSEEAEHPDNNTSGKKLEVISVIVINILEFKNIFDYNNYRK